MVGQEKSGQELASFSVLATEEQRGLLMRLGSAASNGRAGIHSEQSGSINL